MISLTKKERKKRDIKFLEKARARRVRKDKLPIDCFIDLLKV
jgi:hypothetical protein